MKNSGTFIISLDFELNWGVHDVFTVEQYRENLAGTREAVEKMLALFSKYKMNASWATVGLLCFETKEEMMRNLPSRFPSYDNHHFCPYKKLDEIGENELEDPFHYGSSILNMVKKTKGQEIASHTFSHYYCLEEGQTAEQFEADLKASLSLKEKYGTVIKSIVFPRNQINPSYLSICKKYGIETYRGNEKNWIYKESQFYRESQFKRALRLIDSYINITGHHTYRQKDIEKKPMINLPSSRFLRPYDPRLKKLEKLRFRRIKKSMIHAAKRGEIYHLWWHPHNFGKEIDENINFLDKILQLATELDEQYGFESLTMKDASAMIRQRALFEEEATKACYENRSNSFP